MYYIKVAGECMLKMDLEYEKGVFFVRLNGNLTRKKTYKINNYLVPVIKKHQIKYVICNLENVKIIDEAGVDALLHVKCALKKHLGKIFLCGVNKEIISSLKRLHIKTTLSESEALKLCEV